MEDFTTRRLHDVVIRTRGDDPELASGLTVDGNELLVPTGIVVRHADGDPFVLDPKRAGGD
jgi:hypothetical protein